MKKKVLLFTSIGALFLAGVSAVAISGANQLDRLQVKADPTEYSVTFDAESTVDAVQDHWVFSKTTPRGAKVGVVGFNAGIECFSFHNKIFTELHLADFTSTLVNAGAYEFSNITGFAISFSGDGSGMTFAYGKETINGIESGHEYTGLSITPTGYPRFANSKSSVTISSLTIWYSC